MKNNIFTQLSELWGRMNSQENKMVRVAYLSNPDQVFDDLLLPLRIILAVAIFVTLSFGGYYHYHIFNQAFGLGAIAVIGSLLWFIVIEVAKVYLGIRFFRSLSSGAVWQTWTKLALTLAIGGIVAYAFYLSIGISTRAVSTLNQSIEETSLVANNQFSAPPSISTLDHQIAEAEGAIAAAKKSTWRGRPTAEGLRLMELNTNLKNRLVEQRATELAAAQAEHARLMDLQQGQVVKAASQLAVYGGVAEYVTLALLLLLALFERASYENNKQQQDTPTPHIQNTMMPQITTPHVAFSENSTRRPIGFQLPETKPETNNLKQSETTKLKQAETLVATAFQNVSAIPETKLKQPETKVLVQTEIRDDIERAVADEVRKIQRYMAKWNNRGKGGGNPDTILRNLATFFETIKTLQQEGDISSDLKEKVVSYFSQYQKLIYGNN